MNREQEQKLQAFLDGELPEKEAAEVANWIARDGDASALLAELRSTRQALAGFERDIKLPESREFYWSKIEREIQRFENTKAEPVRQPSPWFALLRGALVPAGAFAALVIAGFIATNQFRGARGSEMETALADAGALTYRDYESGATLVWLSYPAENELAQGSPADRVQ